MPNPPHVTLILRSSEVSLATSRLTRCLDNPQTRHEAPGHIADMLVAMGDLLDETERVMPDVFEALAADLRSTGDLRRLLELQP